MRERKRERDTDRQGSMAGLTSVVRSISISTSIIIIIIYFKMQFAEREEAGEAKRIASLVELNELLCCMPSGSGTDEDI